MLKIEDGIPIPTQTARKGTNIEQLRAMKVGQSVFFDAPIVKRATRFYRVAKHLGAKIVIRKEGDGQRMWLIALPTTPMTTVMVPAREAATPVRKAAKKKAVKKVAKKIKRSKVSPPALKVTTDVKRDAKNAKDRERRAAKKAAEGKAVKEANANA